MAPPRHMAAGHASLIGASLAERAGTHHNWSHLFEVSVADTWLVNDERNMGNVIGSSAGEGRIEVFMIDFEKSRALGESPFMNSVAVDAKKLWPTEELGVILKRTRPAQCPQGVIADRTDLAA